MRVTVEFKNRHGAVVRRKLSPGSAIDLFDRCDRERHEVLAVHAPKGKRWTVTEARQQFGMAVGEDHRPG